jgi:NTP pyrophosphatase (non-canonical NTP hydrolase)
MAYKNLRNFAMNIQDYQDAIKQFAAYPGANTGELGYASRGIVEEALELVIALQQDDAVAVVKEAGDVAWNCCQLLNELGESAAQALMIAPRASTTSLLQMAAELMGPVNKFFRDGDRKHILTILKGVGAILLRVHDILKDYPLTQQEQEVYSVPLSIDTALAHNIIKLTARAAANTIRGEGDDR